MPNLSNEEQTPIIECPGNIVVTARPGSGKTFTIIEKIKQISDDLMNYQGIIAISFTNKASNELNQRCKRQGVPARQSFFGTIDKFYIGKIIQPFARHLTKSKCKLEIHTDFTDYDEFKSLEHLNKKVTLEVESLLVKSLAEGHIFLNICGETALYILQHVPEAIDFMKARYTHIFIDEYQDCGEVQHDIFQLLVSNGLIGIAVGDLDQAIYGFTNRFPKYLASLVENDSFEHFQISNNHRCHQSIAEYSLQLIGLRRPVPNENDDIRVLKIEINGDESSIAACFDKYIPRIKKKYSIDRNNQIAILCRSNGSCCIYGQNLETPCKVFEDTELDKLNSNWSRFFSEFLQCYYDDECYHVDYVERFYDPNIDKRDYNKLLTIVESLFSANDTDLINRLDDIVGITKQVYPDYENKSAVEKLRDVLSNIDKLRTYKPATPDEINIMTLHKSKGLEFKVVFHMDLYRWILPPEFDDVDIEQERNLHYVGITRAIDVCYLIQGTYRHNSNGECKKAIPSPFLSENDLESYRHRACWSI